MQFTFVRLCAALFMLVLAACDQIQDTLVPSGPVAPLDAQGRPPVAPDTSCNPVEPLTAVPYRPDQFALFRIAYYCAWGKSAIAARTGNDSDLDAAQPLLRSMAREGLGLVRSNCDEFFRNKGTSQQNIGLGRDLIGFGAATATAIVGLTGGSALALSIIAVSGASLYAGIDTYTKNFLFGADNIEAVRENTLKSLDNNSAAILRSSDTFTFQAVASAIMDNQELCRPASIAAAARLSIRKGELAPAGTDTSALDGPRAAMVASVAGLTAGAVVGSDQLAALCWAADPADDSDAKTAYVVKLLPSSMFPLGPAVPVNWQNTRSVVAGQCNQFSAATRTAIKQRIAQMQAAAGGGGTPATDANRTARLGGLQTPGVRSAPAGVLRYIPMDVR